MFEKQQHQTIYQEVITGPISASSREPKSKPDHQSILGEYSHQKEDIY